MLLCCTASLQGKNEIEQKQPIQYILGYMYIYIYVYLRLHVYIYVYLRLHVYISMCWAEWNGRHIRYRYNMLFYMQSYC